MSLQRCSLADLEGLGWKVIVRHQYTTKPSSPTATYHSAFILLPSNHPHPNQPNHLHPVYNHRYRLILSSPSLPSPLHIVSSNRSTGPSFHTSKHYQDISIISIVHTHTTFVFGHTACSSLSIKNLLASTTSRCGCCLFLPFSRYDTRTLD